jgi:hypothetical protein
MLPDEAHCIQAMPAQPLDARSGAARRRLLPVVAATLRSSAADLDPQKVD